MNIHLNVLACLMTSVCSISCSWAGDLTIPNSFVSGTRAVAAEMNANFNAVETAVDDNNSRLAALESMVTTLQADLATANSTISSLQSQLAAVNSSNVMALNSYLTVGSDSRGPIAVFSGINLQLVNGSGLTDGIPNGLGNMTIGSSARLVLMTIKPIVRTTVIPGPCPIKPAPIT